MDMKDKSSFKIYISLIYKRMFYKILILIVSFQLNREGFLPPFYIEREKTILLLISLAHLA